MIFRKATQEDLPVMMEIVRQAQAFMKSQNVDQWQAGYPTRGGLEGGIRQGNSYVLEEDGVLLGLEAVVFAPEESYEKMTKGKWLTQGAPYGVIHRGAVLGERRGQGLFGELIKGAESLCRDRGIGSIRVDTHPDNKAMGRSLVKNGFVLCGEILLTEGPEAGTPRITLEKILSE